jgi:hypothetical protein
MKSKKSRRSGNKRTKKNTKNTSKKSGTKSSNLISKYTKSTTKTRSVKRRGRQCRIKYMYIVATGASKKSKDLLFLGSNDDAPIVSNEAQIWMICRPAVQKEDPQFYYIFDELGRVLTHRICGDTGNVILENVINMKTNHAKWMIDTFNHKIHPFDNHLLSLDYNPKAKYGILVRRSDSKQFNSFNQTWDFREKINNLTTNFKSDRARVWEYNKEDIDNLFVSYQNSKLLKFARKLPNHGYVKVDQSPGKIFCYIDVSHWDKYADKFREKIIEYYDFADSSSLYYFVEKYYPFIVKYHGLTPKSKLLLATKLYKKGYHISLYQKTKDLVGKKLKFKSTGLNHLVNRSYTKMIGENESQYTFAPDKYYGIAWFFIETDFKSPLTCSNSQMPIPHVSIGLILYEPGNTVSSTSNEYENNVSNLQQKLNYMDNQLENNENSIQEYQDNPKQYNRNNNRNNNRKPNIEYNNRNNNRKANIEYNNRDNNGDNNNLTENDNLNDVYKYKY